MRIRPVFALSAVVFVFFRACVCVCLCVNASSVAGAMRVRKTEGQAGG